MNPHPNPNMKRERCDVPADEQKPSILHVQQTGLLEHICLVRQLQLMINAVVSTKNQEN